MAHFGGLGFRVRSTDDSHIPQWQEPDGIFRQGPEGQASGFWVQSSQNPNAQSGAFAIAVVDWAFVDEGVYGRLGAFRRVPLRDSEGISNATWGVKITFRVLQM